MSSSIQNELDVITNARYGVDVRTAMHDGLAKIETVVVDCGTISSLPKTISGNSKIKSTMVVVNSYLSNPNALASDLTVTTSNNSLTITGTLVSGSSTNLILYLTNANV